MDRHRCAENCDWRDVGAALAPDPMKCRKEIRRTFNERDRTTSLGFYYPERPLFPAVAPARQGPTFCAADVLPRLAVKSARFRDVARLVCDDPCSAYYCPWRTVDERGESKNASGDRHFERLTRDAAQFNELSQVICGATLEKIERHRLQRTAVLILW